MIGAVAYRVVRYLVKQPTRIGPSNARNKG
jgi:hypothetical protein